ncbi:hypothetical protein SmJEL517_g01052 [Synchytrium microbalum]|uniref:peptidylprolyl isomerase n=1 Tax=Synchytrium microbalum TaxID=1806994 RepID=A0A507CHR7_9FUNG|nr:uncharacterized protein SmJEL517_g01052 [Synchytrium microbalum]TPX37153.1 hypothetical protein SmJEL517_g01052 [Synchytrium microbalum]
MDIAAIEAEIAASNKENDEASKEDLPKTGGPIDEKGFTLLISDGSLKKKVLKEGEGDSFPDGTYVTVHYSGMLDNGKVFDSSRQRNRPFEFKIGQGQVIKGWDMGVATMKAGEISMLACGPDLAYGAKGSAPHIKPNATLYFEIEILSATPPHDPISQRITEAKSMKEKANKHYGDKQYPSAIHIYAKALDRISYSWGATPYEETEIRTLRLALYSNLAAARLNNNELEESVIASEAVLEMDQRNVKALFRLSKAKKGLGSFGDAISYLELAAKYDPNDSTIRAELASVKKAHEAFKSKEKKIYSTMLFGSEST